jgi:hypothetical protein
MVEVMRRAVSVVVLHDGTVGSRASFLRTCIRGVGLERFEEVLVSLVVF